MKYFILTVMTLVSLSSFAKESGCMTDGCVMRKNGAFDAVVKFIHENDDCMNANSWAKGIKKLNDDHFEISCGDATYTEKIKLRVELFEEPEYRAVRVK